MFDVILFEKCINLERKYVFLLVRNVMCFVIFLDIIRMRCNKGGLIVCFSFFVGFFGRIGREKKVKISR